MRVLKMKNPSTKAVAGGVDSKLKVRPGANLRTARTVRTSVRNQTLGKRRARPPRMEHSAGRTPFAPETWRQSHCGFIATPVISPEPRPRGSGPAWSEIYHRRLHLLHAEKRVELAVVCSLTQQFEGVGNLIRSSSATRNCPHEPDRLGVRTQLSQGQPQSGR